MKSMPTHEDIMIESHGEIEIEQPKSPPANLGTVRGFLKEFRRIGQESLLDFSLTEFKPFWTTLLDAARAAQPKSGAPQRKWRLRSRAVRPVADTDTEERVRVYANRLLEIAVAIESQPYISLEGKSIEDTPHQTKLAESAVSFSRALKNRPSILIHADSTEMQNLENTVKNFTNIN